MGMIAEKRAKQAQKKSTSVLSMNNGRKAAPAKEISRKPLAKEPPRPLDTKARAETCSNCGSDSNSCRRRTFSEQALTVLLLWNEINPNAIDQGICDDCYQELRDVLIDRSDEIESSMQRREEIAKIQTRLNGLAS